jgi:sugar O-acyltransferase (sialic acid O-acetyltransferase NeuD family)
MGAGGHGRVALDALLTSGVAVAGILDPGLRAGEQVFGMNVCGGDEWLERLSPADVLLVNGVGVNPDTGSRSRLFEKLKVRGFEFVAVRHPTAVVARECSLGEGLQIMAGAVVQNRARIGANVVINTRASVDHDCVVDAHAFIAPGAVLGGEVTVGVSAFVGAGAVVLPRVQIGTNAVVGAGSVVIRDVPAGWTVVGNPAQKIGENK